MVVPQESINNSAGRIYFTGEDIRNTRKPIYAEIANPENCVNIIGIVSIPSGNRTIILHAGITVMICALPTFIAWLWVTL